MEPAKERQSSAAGNVIKQSWWKATAATSKSSMADCQESDLSSIPTA